jgi:hypothetical protein
MTEPHTRKRPGFAPGPNPQTEISLAVAAYNLMRMLNILGERKLHAALQAT